MKHDKRRQLIREMATELAPYLTIEGTNLKALRKATYQKLYAKGLSATAALSWWNAIHAQAIEIANETRPKLGQVG